MTSKPAFKIIATILTTAILGYIGYLLKNSIDSGVLFLDNEESNVIQALALFGPFVLSIIVGWIRQRKIWILSLLTIVASTGIGVILGENNIERQVPLFIACIILPYLFCLFAILKEKGPDRPYTTEHKDPVTDMTGDEVGVDITWMAD